MEVNTKSLSRIFINTTTSYKFLFFNALTNSLLKENFKTNKFSLKDLVSKMIALAWFSQDFYKLKSAGQDQLINIFRELNIRTNSIYIQENLEKLISEQFEFNAEIQNLKKYVPFRLLTPFFERELRGIADNQRNGMIEKLAAREFDSKKPLYRFSHGESIEVHTEWANFIKMNFDLIQAWSDYKYSEYLEKYNPDVPGIIKKVRPPRNRNNNLSSERKIWQDFISVHGANCIFTGKDISQNFALDHFIPWSFVVHDEIRNLIPIDPNFNSSKSNYLPPRSSINKFLNVQFKFYKFLHKHGEYSYINSYTTILNTNELVPGNKFKNKMEAHLNLLTKTASALGFLELN